MLRNGTRVFDRRFGILGLIAILASAGCGGGDDVTKETGTSDIQSLVSDVTGAARDKGDRFKNLFAEGAMPNKADYADPALWVDIPRGSSPSVSGDEATFPVTIGGSGGSNRVRPPPEGRRSPGAWPSPPRQVRPSAPHRGTGRDAPLPGSAARPDPLRVLGL